MIPILGRNTIDDINYEKITDEISQLDGCFEQMISRETTLER